MAVPPHSFAVFATSNVSDVEEIGDGISANVNVYGGNGEIVIEGEYNTAEVYDLQGRKALGLNVPAGMYVVNVDGATFKVAVK